jgi:hypothetical protein
MNSNLLAFLLSSAAIPIQEEPQGFDVFVPVEAERIVDDELIPSILDPAAGAFEIWVVGDTLIGDDLGVKSASGSRSFELRLKGGDFFFAQGPSAARIAPAHQDVVLGQRVRYKWLQVLAPHTEAWFNESLPDASLTVTDEPLIGPITSISSPMWGPFGVMTRDWRSSIRSRLESSTFFVDDSRSIGDVGILTDLGDAEGLDRGAYLTIWKELSDPFPVFSALVNRDGGRRGEGGANGATLKFGGEVLSVHWSSNVLERNELEGGAFPIRSVTRSFNEAGVARATLRGTVRLIDEASQSQIGLDSHFAAAHVGRPVMVTDEVTGASYLQYGERVVRRNEGDFGYYWLLRRLETLGFAPCAFTVDEYPNMGWGGCALYAAHAYLLMLGQRPALSHLLEHLKPKMTSGGIASADSLVEALAAQGHHMIGVELKVEQLWSLADPAIVVLEPLGDGLDSHFGVLLPADGLGQERLVGQTKSSREGDGLRYLLSYPGKSTMVSMRELESKFLGIALIKSEDLEKISRSSVPVSWAFVGLVAVLAGVWMFRRARVGGMAA